MTRCDVAIIGAGPYGLSAAAHLLKLKGLDVRVFGAPMSFGRQHARRHVSRSAWTATHIADPNGLLTLEAYQEASGHQFSTPVPLDEFIRYGRWFQCQAVPDLDRRKVTRVEGVPTAFASMSKGVIRWARGAWLLPRVLVHSLNDHLSSTASPPRSSRTPRSTVTFRSSPESGFSLSEGGRVRLSQVRCSMKPTRKAKSSRSRHGSTGSRDGPPRPSIIGWGNSPRRLLYAPTDVGPAGISQLLARPDLVRRLPRVLQDKLRERATRPAGARWLVSRLKDVPIRLGASVVSATVVGEQLKVRLHDGSERTVDHVLLGTGYNIDISRYEFLAPELLESIRCFNGFPLLNLGLETSVPGLHILGAPAAWSFGPLMQFVSGTHYASRALSRCIAGKDISASGA